MSQIFRRTEINARRARRAKLALLRTRHAAAKSASERYIILTKAQKVSPGLLEKDFLLVTKPQA